VAGGRGGPTLSVSGAQRVRERSAPKFAQREEQAEVHPPRPQLQGRSAPPSVADGRML